MTITGAADFSNGGQIGVAGDQSALARGDDVTLIAGPGGAFASLDQDTVVGFQGTRMYTYDLGITGLGLGAHVANVQADPRWKSLSEGFLSGQAFLNQGTDLLADSGMTNALRAAAGSESGPAFFGAISYGSSRYDTGSHIKVHGLSLLLGGAYGVSLDPGRLTIGAFFEYGTGSYDSHNDFANFASVKGDGDTDYVGGGLLTRFDFNNHGSGAFYAELSARAGRLSTDFNTLDIPGYRVSYDLSTPYFGLHAGLGHVFDLAGSTSLDLYAKYFWTHQEGKDFVAIDPISFGDVDSHRLRVGTRLSQGITDQVKFFAGAAYENEFSGKAEASSRGLRFDVPELKGSTGIGELGLTVLPNERVNLDVGVQGYVGTRKGVSGSVRLNFEF
ncbi:MAG: autotransporter outer membrane beta-barrel domain-containing protein [Deltaproteobacteria bacterium]|nr:autotransporter outer membrane beta-barrel domain-containing protein [Deltaproteobacteria bacterium]